MARMYSLVMFQGEAATVTVHAYILMIAATMFHEGVVCLQATAYHIVGVFKGQNFRGFCGLEANHNNYTYEIFEVRVLMFIL